MGPSTCAAFASRLRSAIGEKRYLFLIAPVDYSESSSAPEPALSLCSSFLGYYSHAGFLEGLMAEGFQLKHVAGASSGALIAGLAGAGLSTKDMLDFLVSRDFRKSWMEMRQFLLLPLKRILFYPHTGLTTGKKALACLKKLLGDTQIEDCEIPSLAISVTNLTKSRTEIRQTGPLAEMIVASCAYPSVIAQQLVNEEFLWDGGIANDGPIGQWIGNPSISKFLIHSVGINRLPPKKTIGILGGILRSHDAITAELFALRKQLADMSGQTILRWNTPTPRPSIFVSEEAGRNNFTLGVESGRKAAEAYFADKALAI